MFEELTLIHNRMILIEQGDGEFLINDVPYSFTTGTLIFGIKGERFSLKCGENVRYLYIDFNGPRGENLYHRFGIYPVTRKRDGFNGLIPFCKDSLLSTLPENVDVAAESVLLYIFSRLSANSMRQNEIIQKVIEFTEGNFRNPELSISVVAHEIGYNAKYLSHFFKKNMNIGYSEYLRSLRFKYAISLFELGISSVKNVALLSGFSDPLYFSNSFKKAIGISPKDFISSISNRINDQ